MRVVKIDVEIRQGGVLSSTDGKGRMYATYRVIETIRTFLFRDDSLQASYPQAALHV